MSDRQYGIPIGHIHGARLPSPPRSSYPASDVSPVSSFRRPLTPPDRVAVPDDSQALRDIDNLYNPRFIMSPSPRPDGPYGAPGSVAGFHTSLQRNQDSQSSLAPLTAGYHPVAYSSPPRSPDRTAMRAAPVAAAGGAGLAAAGFDAHLPRGSYYHDDGYDNFDPGSIADDGEDGLEEQPRSRNGVLAPAAAEGGGGGTYGALGTDPEKSEWLAKQSSNRRRWTWIVGVLLAVLVLGGIAGGVAGGILANKGKSGSGSGSSSGGGHGTHSGGLYDINSDEVQAVLNNKNLHKVFPAMDYTPNYAQYPQCLAPGGGPVQNNVTIDVAIMSQLTPAIRLYGTDCNQTQLVMEAINLLGLNQTMKVWLGVYLNGNQTTNDRQIAAMYDILDSYDHSSFVGVIVGNEVLYSKYMSATQLATTLQDIRSNFTTKGIDLPVATADLGDNWTASLAASSDIVMANIHPFFAGVTPADAPGWAYSFWHNKDTPLTTTATGSVGSLTYPKQIISEIGWPSQGGNDCGDASDPAYGCTSSTDGAVASIANLNSFLQGWVCDALKNGTTFFWFEAFDEPWKHQFDTAHDKWEPYWGLFDSDRNLKSGVQIPDCGTSVNKPY